MDSASTAKRELRLVQWQADTALRDAFRDVAPHVADAVVASSRKVDGSDVPTITPQGRLDALKAVDRVLDALFGTERGSASVVADIIARNTANARRRVYRAAARETEVRLPDDLRRAAKE